MSVLIVACGDLGSTVKAGNILADMLGGATVTEKLSDINADTIVLGTNIHFNKFNKRFIKAVKLLKKSNAKADIYVYIVGAEIEKSEHHIQAARELLPTAKDIRYVWGELKTDGTKGLKQFAINSFIEGRKKDGLPKPRLLEKELRKIYFDIIQK